jgi:hypothetical protein
MSSIRSNSRNRRGGSSGSGSADMLPSGSRSSGGSSCSTSSSLRYSSNCFNSTYRLLLLSALLLAQLTPVVLAKAQINRKKQQNSLFIAAGSIVAFGLILLCLYFCKRLCPTGIQFTALEMDEIRLEQLDDIEQGLEENIKNMKVGVGG